MRRFAETVLPPALRVLNFVSALLLFVMMTLTFADVVGRYVFTAPIFGAAEMVQFLLAMTIFSGLCLINAYDEHITVELFEPFLDRRIPKLRRIIVQSFSVVVMAIIAFQLSRFAIDAYRLGNITVVLEWPVALVAGTAAGLSVISLIIQVLGLALPARPHTLSEHGSPL